MENISQTQLSNIAVLGGLIVIILQQFGVVADKDQVVFILASLWSLSWTAYNYWQRFKKGDIYISGIKK